MQQFPFAFDPRYRPVLQILGITPGTARVEVTDHILDARFGVWRVATPLENVTGTSITGPYMAIRAIGPRLSLADRGISFGTNTDQGLCIRFRKPVPGIDPLRVIRHPGLTVTVAEPAALADVLAARGRPAS